MPASQAASQAASPRRVALTMRDLLCVVCHRPDLLSDEAAAERKERGEEWVLVAPRARWTWEVVRQYLASHVFAGEAAA